MSFAEIHAALAQDPSGDDRFAAAGTPIVLRSALTLLTQIIGLPLLAIDLPPPSLAIRFPKDRVPEEVVPQFGREMTRYLAWRRIVLDLQLLATWQAVDADPWDTLRRLTRLTLGPLESDALYALECRMDGRAPAALTRAQAIAVQDQLSGHSRLGFRRACRVLDQLHAHELAEALDILPPVIGALPEKARIREHLLLPPRLAAFATEHGITSPLAHCWTLAVKAGLLPADADPDPASAFPPALWKALAAADPRAHGVDLQPVTMKNYRERVARALVLAGAPDPRIDPVGAEWSSLRSAVRATGCSPTSLSTLAVRAGRDGLCPSELTAEWIAELLEREEAPSRRRAIRGAAMLLDRLREDPRIPDRLLPAEPTGLTRQRARAGERRPGRRRTQKANPAHRAWANFLAAAEGEGVPAAHLDALAWLRPRAEHRRLRPPNLDAPALLRLCQNKRSDAAEAARALDALRHYPALLAWLPAKPLGPIRVGRGLGADHPELATEVDQLLAEQGVKASTRREARAAIAGLCRAAIAAGAPIGGLDDLLHLDSDSLDWREDAARAEEYRKTIQRLRTFRFLPWTPAWRALQQAVVAAGVAMVENPIPALLGIAEGRAPATLDAAWAREIDRRYRSAGRADLALTFAANLARLDDLHEVPAVAATGLLPARIGQYRVPKAELPPSPA